MVTILLNKLTIVAKNPQTYFIKRLSEELGEHKIQHFNPWSDPIPASCDKILFRSSGIYHSDIDLDFVKNSQADVMNPLKSLEIFRSKSKQYEFFEAHHHPALQWWRLADWTNGPSDREFLVKPDMGQGGWGIEVLRAPELLKWKHSQEAKGDMSWVVQPYLNTQEYRVFFMGEERICLKRFPKNGERISNFAQEGEAQLVDLPTEIKAVIEPLIEDSRAYYGAIDLLDSVNGPIILELNVTPGIEQVEALGGRNLIQTLLSANFFCQIVKV
jgi:glutathione synthase/RimK-type ligase-like ATP-grasp enzyme